MPQRLSLSSGRFFGQVHQTISSSSPRATPISRKMTHIARFALPLTLTILLALAQAACTRLPAVPDTGPPIPVEPVPDAVIPAAAQRACVTASPCPVCPVCPSQSPEPAEAQFRPAAWNDLPGWNEASHLDSLRAFVTGCARIRARPAWKTACADARNAGVTQQAAARAFFETHFSAYRVIAPDGAVEGLVTGYYEPVLSGRRERSPEFRYPVFGVPDDLVVVDLAELYPELRHLRLRGRLQGRRLVPYLPRAAIDAAGDALPAQPLAWVADAVELFFLQIQGSGQIELASGERLRLGFADQNGYPYRSLGRALVDRGELKLEQASMQGIKAWAKRNPGKLQEALNTNPSYVFFRELPLNGAATDGTEGPLGALGVPLTPGYSIAVDPRFVSLGAPVYLATTYPLSTLPLQRLVVAQDTGGAIRGAIRADFFWGTGHDAGAQAGRMRQEGRMWLLWPRDAPLPRPE